MQSMSATPTYWRTSSSSNRHGMETIGDLTNNFSVLKKCNEKLDCLIYEMLFKKKKKPCLNAQLISAKLFI